MHPGANSLSQNNAKTSTENVASSESSQESLAKDWTGHDDAENPQNWPWKKKTFHVVYVGMQCFVITLGSSIYTPAIADVAATFNVDFVVAVLPLTTYILGLALGPVVSAPISETYGRKIVYQVFFPISLLFTLGAGFAQHFRDLVVCRFFAGMIGSACLAVSGGTACDLIPPLTRPQVTVLFFLLSFAGPALGPAIGGYATMRESWRWTQWIILLAGSIPAVMGFFQPETFKFRILKKRAKRFGVQPPMNPLLALPLSARTRFVFTITIARPLFMLATEPIVAFLAIYTAVNFGVMFLLFASFPIIFESPYPEVQVYHFNQGEAGLVSLGMAIGFVSAVIIILSIHRRIVIPRATGRHAGGDGSTSPVKITPEDHTYSAMIGSVLLPVSLFWFAWTARSDIPWIVPELATILFGCGVLLVFFTAVQYQLDTFGPLHGASAMAANGILRYIFGATFPLFAEQMYTKLGVGWGTSILGFISFTLLPVPWILNRYGPALRKRSSFAVGG